METSSRQITYPEPLYMRLRGGKTGDATRLEGYVGVSGDRGTLTLWVGLDADDPGDGDVPVRLTTEEAEMLLGWLNAWEKES